MLLWESVYVFHADLMNALCTLNLHYIKKILLSILFSKFEPFSYTWSQYPFIHFFTRKSWFLKSPLPSLPSSWTRHSICQLTGAVSALKSCSPLPAQHRRKCIAIAPLSGCFVQTHLLDELHSWDVDEVPRKLGQIPALENSLFICQYWLCCPISTQLATPTRAQHLGLIVQCRSIVCIYIRPDWYYGTVEKSCWLVLLSNKVVIWCLFWHAFTRHRKISQQ